MLNNYLAITFSKIEAYKLYFCRKLASSACEKHSRIHTSNLELVCKAVNRAVNTP